jgi:predicted lipase
MFLRIIYLFYFLFFSSSLHASKQSDICAWLSGAAYCGKENYDTMVLGGPAQGFVVHNSLYDIKSDLQGFIGTLNNNIYIVYRGSSSPLNWIYDFEIRQIKYDSYPDCEDCMVHKGFYHSALDIKDQTLFHLKALKLKYPRYNIIVSGHSYGAAVCQLVAMEIAKLGLGQVSVYNFGQPRVGNSVYAFLVNQVIEQHWRFVHNRDIVPHVPPPFDFVDGGLEYMHSCVEVFEDENGVLNVCNNTKCEDVNCSSQYKITELNSADHSVYLGHRLSCEESTVNL